MNRRSFLLFTGAFASSVIIRPHLGAVPLKVLSRRLGTTTNPASGNQRLLIDKSPHKLIRINSDGVATALQDVPPRLWGDGIHDDSPWLQWMIDHHNYVDLEGRTYRLGKGLHLHEGDKLTLVNGIFLGPTDGAALTYHLPSLAGLALT